MRISENTLIISRFFHVFPKPVILGDELLLKYPHFTISLINVDRRIFSEIHELVNGSIIRYKFESSSKSC